ncbi:phosphotransferase enzyme family protein [Pseudomassariella vexata]|uniref:Phosphotransferase enzyme family protein n=1 Tax=Pseudomassariella vexata TaxID=1141098 RepID=A0A1Y2DY58_9PEZI|nr:phosphotransferase enzyme family protein [Pseudomassariella vexata]ORY64240.1 phosphotransferase enzyme family protein [Pseudomassariella vexata]
MAASIETRIIEAVSDLTVEFLRTALDLPSITSFSTTCIGTGQVGDCYRVALQYSQGAPSNAPATVILKIASRDPRSRASGLSLGIYERETHFYTELAPSLMKTTDCLAKCYHSAFRTSTGAFTLLLEDAGTTALVGDDIQGATLEQAQVAMRELGRLHAAMMMSPERFAWLVQDSPVSQPLVRQLFAGFAERYRDQIDPGHLDICRRFVASFGEYMEKRTEPGVCEMGIIHGDYRMDNMLFTPGEGSSKPKLMVVDWQLITAGPVAADLAYFLGCSLKVEDRRQWQDRLLRTYCNALAEAAGEPVMTLEICKREVRMQAFFGVTMGIVSSIMAARTERGDQMFMTVMARHCELVKDMDSLALLPPPDDNGLMPLLPELQDEQQHEPGPEKDWNESWYFDFVDEAQGVAGWIRLGLTPNRGGNWYHAFITWAGRPTVIVSDFAAPAPDNLLLNTADITASHEVLKPLEKFRLTLTARGEAFKEIAESLYGKQGTSSKVQLDLLYETTGVPYKYRITPRYEIPCKVTGTVTVDGEIVSIHAVPGQRDHSVGVRDWWGMEWAWSAFILSNGQYVHTTDLRLPNAPSMSIGYVQRDSSIQEVEAITCHEAFDDDGLAEWLTMNIRVMGIAEELSVVVTPKSHTPLKLVNDDGRVTVLERVWGEVCLPNGEKGVGWFEWNRNTKE